MKFKAFFLEKLEEEILKYLMSTWCNDQNWVLWGRRDNCKVSMRITTMKFETNWLVIKLLFLLPLNHPRVDILVYVIDKTFLSKFN